MVFDINIANALTLVLTNLIATLVGQGRENKTISYLIFSKRRNKDIDNFINNLEKIFEVNRITDNRKLVVTTSCLKSIAASYHDGLAVVAN